MPGGLHLPIHNVAAVCERQLLSKTMHAAASSLSSESQFRFGQLPPRVSLAHSARLRSEALLSDGGIAPSSSGRNGHEAQAAASLSAVSA